MIPRKSLLSGGSQPKEGNVQIDSVLQRNHQSQRTKDGNGASVLDKLRLMELLSNRKALCIVIGLDTVQQLSGNFSIMQYLESLFTKIKTIDLNVATIIALIVGLLSSSIVTTMVEKVGRRKLLISSTFGLLITLVIFSDYFSLIKTFPDYLVIDILAIIDVICYQLSYQLGLGTLTNTLLVLPEPSIFGFIISKLYQVNDHTVCDVSYLRDMFFYLVRHGGFLRTTDEREKLSGNSSATNKTLKRDETVLITFEGSALPEKIQLYGLFQKSITPYIEPVKTCNCFRHGQVTKFCRSPKICINCDQPTGDNPHNCQEPAKKCLHCSENHPTFDCIPMRTNKEVNTILAHNDVSVYEALTMAKDKMGIPAQKTQNDNTQTINNNKNFLKLPMNSANKTFLLRQIG
ncbi:hypothetical protein E2986_10665 [Frieseomelitta varia]|uniref:Uncharacterized protein n=1 Tax=Frieseomelitta varia TaxID=561572 RepID=A0A833RVD7_9HYME|nr:hypothetical protein E2986_10665 [Frieseomelitta varia]